jgi:hypothetical protein
MSSTEVKMHKLKKMLAEGITKIRDSRRPYCYDTHGCGAHNHVLLRCHTCPYEKECWEKCDGTDQ